MALNSDGARTALINYILDRSNRHPSLKISIVNVLAIFETGYAIPRVDFDFVFLEFGHQVYDQLGKPKRQKGAGSGFLHIMSVHEIDFYNNGIIDVFNHLNNCLLYGARVNDASQNEYYVLRVAGKLTTTIVRIGSNGYFGSAWPTTRLDAQYLLESGQITLVQEEESPEREVQTEDVVSGEKTPEYEVTAFYDAVKLGGLYVSAARASSVQETRDLIEAIENRWHKLPEQADSIEGVCLDLMVLKLAYTLRRETGRTVKFRLLFVRLPEEDYEKEWQFEDLVSTKIVRKWQLHLFAQLIWAYYGTKDVQLTHVALFADRTVGILPQDSRFEVVSSSPVKVDRSL